MTENRLARGRDVRPPRDPREPRERRPEVDTSAVLVIGLGRFGTALASTLDSLDRRVLGVERDPDLIRTWSGRIPLVEADATNPEALEQLGAREFHTVVVGVGTELEASVLITGNLVDLGIPQIWGKAISAEHGRILERIGAHHVVYPEYDAGQRVAHLVSGKMLDYIEMEDGFTIVKMRPPRELHGFTIAQAQVRKRYGVTIIGVKAPGVAFQYAADETRIDGDDVLIVSGDSSLLERFAARP
ncbi:potassium channel family protein [Serinibacter arcticus]|uniref:Trk system potassium uptake protein TrkA n=1 Tax=Serinibacter arcticus TaxID=1655435 RepID=A0A4Z1EAG2_9MICO|nr:TrkA family potassium uptake protein [Serinibacter arcticus]TGO06457.1 Trk system potassium uptake protein TrkA [Serinibacter arcticus]